MERRRFLQYVIAAPLLPLAGCRRQRRDGRALADAGTDRSSPLVLTRQEWDTLEAVAGRIIPSDEDPGAREAGVVGYIDAQLAHPPVSGFRRLIGSGLRRLDLLAGRLHRRGFAQLPPEQQDQVLWMLQRARRGPGQTGQQFFMILVVLTLEGFLCDPLYGGNHGGVGWKLLAFAPRDPTLRRPYRGRALG